MYQLGFNDICFSWFETLSQEDKAKSRFMGISAYKAQGLVNRVKGMIGGTRKTISKPKQMKLFPQAPEQLKLFPEVSSTSGENIAELEKARKKAVRIKRKLKKKKITDKQLSLFQREKGPENTGLGEDMLKKTLEEQGVDINRVSEFLADFSKNIKEEKKNTFLIQLADCFRESKKTRLGTKLEIMEPYLSDVMDSLQIKMDMANFHFTINHGTTSVGYMAESVNIKNEYHDFTIYLIEEEIDKTYTVNLLVDIDKCLATQPRLADAIMKLCDDRGTTIGIAKQAANNKKGTEGRINGIATRSKDGERQLIVLPLYDVNGEKIGYEKPAGYAYDADVLIDGRRVTRLEAILSHEIAYLFLRRTQKSQKWILKVDQKRIKKFTEKHSEIEWDIKRYEENMEEGLFELVFEIYGMRAERINAEFDFRSLSLEEKETVLKKTFVSAESSFNVHEFFADTLAAYWLVPEFVKEKDRIMFDLFEAIGVWKDIEKGARTDDENNVTDPPGRIGKYYTEIIADDEPGENRWIVKAMRHGASKEAAIDLGRTFRAPPVDDEVKTEIRDAVDSRDASRKTAYKELVKEILEQFPQKTVLYIYKNLYRDLFGFNDVSKKMMALYRELYDDKKTRPVSLFHEICEYLGTLKVIGIRARGDKLFVRIKGRETEVDVRRARKSLKEDGEDWINWTEQEINKPENRHYLLRILQREIFGEKDELLTKKIKDLGERGYRRSAETDTKKAGMATLDQMIRELARDMDITGMENEIKVFYEKYIRLAMRVPVGGQILLSSIRAEHIADMFYLKKAYQFDLFELLEGKRETKWVKRDGAVTDEYVFYNRNDGTYVNKVSEAGKKTFLGKATDGRFGLEDRAHDGGRNIGNFMIKTFSLNKWFQKTEGEMSLNIDRGKDTNDPYALCRYYETIGAHVDWRLLSGSMLITGGLDAGISTKKETERIEGLEKYVRNVWSQRKRDRYFRLTKDIETARLAEANQAFTDAHMDVDIDSLRKIQPEEVAEFIQHYDGATRELEKDMALNDEVKARLGSFCRKYLEIKEEFIRCGYAPEDEYMVKCFNGEIIADMFYLAEKDGFNVLDLRSKNRTKWMKEENGITIHYEFEKEKDRSVSMYEVDQNKPRRKIACFNEFSYYLDDLDADGGKNLGNFLTKTVYFLLWANKKQKKTEFVISFEISGALKEYYMTTGARIGSRTDFGDEIARVDLVGGLRAGILTPQQAKRIKDPNGRHRLNPFIWRVWSQRKLDRYFRLTKAIETEKLVEANRAFTEARAATDIEDLQKIQPEEVAEFIKTYLTEKVKEETDTIVFAHGTTKDAISNLDAGFLKKKLSFQGGRVEDILRLIGTHIEGKLYGDEKEMLIYCLSELLVNTHFRGKETMGTEAYLYVPEKRRDPGVLKFVVSQKGIREERYWGILKKTAAKFSQKGNKGYEYFMDVIQRKKDRTRVGDGSALFWVGRLMERTNVYLEYTRKGEEIITNIWIDLGPLLEGDAHDEQGKETVVFAHGMTEGDINVFKKIEEEKEPVRMPGAGHVINFVRAETGKNIWRSKSYAFGECLGELLNNACMRGNGVVSSHAYVYEAGEHKEYILRFNISQKGLNEEVYWHLLKRTAKNFAQQDKKGPAYLQDTEKREREEITIGGGSGFKFVGRLMEETDVYLEYTRNGENIETDIWVRLEPFLGETFDAGQKETTIRDLAGEMIIKKITKAKIQQVDRKSQELRTRLKNSWAVMPEESRKTPIDIVIDLSLVSKEDLQENIETWAYLFLLLFKQENVNFVFEKGSEILKGVRLSEELANDVAQAPEVEDVLRDLKAAIKKNAKFSDFQLEDEKFDKILDKRVKTVRSEPILLENREKPEKPVEITVTSQECLIWASKNDKLLEENQYPIAMEGFTLNEAGGVPLRNFEAAVMIGFAKALLVLAKRRDIRKKPGEERELPLLKKRLLNQLNGLYSLCIDDIIRFTEDTLDSMVHTSPIVRLNLAIDLALSKITRMPVGGLIELHRAIQSALQAA
ncbi:MAG: hypothetical protein KKG84_05390 [Candidatus Omnitrophica bacterium]|nr:hypothetical protein [Candidatus Omnitrophota bacterium]